MKIKLLAYLLGDGCVVHTSPEFIVGKQKLKEDFEKAVREFGGVRSAYSVPTNRTPYITVTNIQGKRGPYGERIRSQNGSAQLGYMAWIVTINLFRTVFLGSPSLNSPCS